ncbi:MAG: hypothetical protein WEC83_01265 [Patescibacteria group bacterium]
MIEPLKNILGGGNRDYLQRIYLSSQFEKTLKKIHPTTPRVSVSGAFITLHCPSNAAAAFWRLRRARLYAELINLIGKTHGYTVRIKIAP